MKCGIKTGSVASICYGYRVTVLFLHAAAWQRCFADSDTICDSDYIAFFYLFKGSTLGV